MLSVTCRDDYLIYLTTPSYTMWNYIPGDFYSYHTGVKKCCVSLKEYVMMSPSNFGVNVPKLNVQYVTSIIPIMYCYIFKAVMTNIRIINYVCDPTSFNKDLLSKS